MPLPALSRRDHLHHAIVGEDAEHGLHLRPELILRERLEENLFGLNMRQPSSPNGVVTLCCHCPSDRLAFEARIAEQPCNRICAHSFPFCEQPAASRRASLAYSCIATNAPDIYTHSITSSARASSGHP